MGLTLAERPAVARTDGQPYRGVVRRVAAGPGKAAFAPPIVHDVLRSPGKAPDPAARSALETRFGHEFGNVRVHDDRLADESARAVNAAAYTVGRDIVFARDRYQPGSGPGRRLLAHELAHVVQQASGEQRPGDSRPGAALPVGPADDVAEREADAAAEAAVGSHAIPADHVVGRLSDLPPAVTRQPADPPTAGPPLKLTPPFQAKPSGPPTSDITLINGLHLKLVDELPIPAATTTVPIRLPGIDPVRIPVGMPAEGKNTVDLNTPAKLADPAPSSGPAGGLVGDTRIDTQVDSSFSLGFHRGGATPDKSPKFDLQLSLVLDDTDLLAPKTDAVHFGIGHEPSAALQLTLDPTGLLSPVIAKQIGITLLNIAFQKDGDDFIEIALGQSAAGVTGGNFFGQTGAQGEWHVTKTLSAILGAQVTVTQNADRSYDSSLAFVGGVILHGPKTGSDAPNPAAGEGGGGATTFNTSNIPVRAAEIAKRVAGPEFETEVPGQGPASSLASQLDDLVGQTIQKMQDAPPDQNYADVDIRLPGTPAVDKDLEAGLRRIVSAIVGSDPSSFKHLNRVTFSIYGNADQGPAGPPVQRIPIAVN